VPSRGQSVAAGKTGSEPGTVASLRRAIRPLEQLSAPHSRVQGWAGPPRCDELCIQVSLACAACITAASSRLQALGRMAVSRLKMLDSSLCKIARRVNHRVVEQAPGDGRFSRRLLLGADEFMFNTNRRGSETRSNGQEERVGLALLDGVMDQLHKRGTTAVQLALRSRRGTAKRRTELNNQAHNIAQRPSEQGTRRDTWVPPRSS
jgi:hypothetical protein